MAGPFSYGAPHPNPSSWGMLCWSQLVSTLLFNARCTLAEPTSRLGPDTDGLANVNGFPTRRRLSRTHQETLMSLLADRRLQRVQCNCLSQGVVVNKDSFTVLTDANVHMAAIRQMWMGSRRNVGNVSHGFVSICLWLCWMPIGVTDRVMCSGHKSVTISWSLNLHVSSQGQSVRLYIRFNRWQHSVSCRNNQLLGTRPNISA